MSNEHVMKLIKTSMFGTWWQASCSCGWLSPRSYKKERLAREDYRNNHVTDIKTTIY